MQYFSTNRQSPCVTFREATLRGQPDDRGLYLPVEIPRVGAEFVVRLRDRSNADIAFDVIRPYAGASIPDEKLYEICAETVNFAFPLVEISDRISVLELFHGPTLAFKDVGARFMSRCLRHFSQEVSTKTIVIVATSGDTGGAVAAGFHNVDGVEVVILYPSGKVSEVQELQLTTLGGNVTAVEVNGVFDDCQALAKTALADNEIASRVQLTSANSINIARWLPQQIYYFVALGQWPYADPPVISVPSGNFGNLASGVTAHAAGLSVKKFIAACNANDVVARYLKSGAFEPRPTFETLSNAMDVGDPSNFVRILEILGNDRTTVQKNLEAASVSDETTSTTIRHVFDQYGYTLDPHGAVGYRALADHLDRCRDERGIFLETAHPIKFDSVSKILGVALDQPQIVRDLYSRKKKSIRIDPDYSIVKELLMSKI
jgi:threonine synthase